MRPRERRRRARRRCAASPLHFPPPHLCVCVCVFVSRGLLPAAQIDYCMHFDGGWRGAETTRGAAAGCSSPPPSTCPLQTLVCSTSPTPPPAPAPRPWLALRFRRSQRLPPLRSPTPPRHTYLLLPPAARQSSSVSLAPFCPVAHLPDPHGCHPLPFSFSFRSRLPACPRFPPSRCSRSPAQPSHAHTHTRETLKNKQTKNGFCFRCVSACSDLIPWLAAVVAVVIHPCVHRTLPNSNNTLPSSLRASILPSPVPSLLPQASPPSALALSLFFFIQHRPDNTNTQGQQAHVSIRISSRLRVAPFALLRYERQSNSLVFPPSLLPPPSFSVSCPTRWKSSRRPRW